MKLYRGNQLVAPGIYLDLRELAFRSMDEEGRLPGSEAAVWRRVPAIAMLVVAPAVSLAYFVFLPLVGFVMLGGVVGLKLYELAKRAAAGALPMLRPAWKARRSG